MGAQKLIARILDIASGDKDAVARLILDSLSEAGYALVRLLEPGGSPEATEMERLRELVRVNFELFCEASRERGEAQDRAELAEVDRDQWKGLWQDGVKIASAAIAERDKALAELGQALKDWGRNEETNLADADALARENDRLRSEVAGLRGSGFCDGHRRGPDPRDLKSDRCWCCLENRVETLVAETYRLRPRSIGTHDQLEALPDHTVLLDAEMAVWERDSQFARHGHPWWQTGDEVEYPSARIELPAIVLWSPEVRDV